MADIPTANGTAPRTVFHGPGEGHALRIGALPTALKVPADWTGGAYEMHEQPVAPKFLVSPHTHEVEDQVTYVVEGELGFLVGEEEFTAPAGSCVLRPRGLVHALWNPTDAPARMLEISNPGAAFERYFYEFDSLTVSGAAQAESIHELGARYGITFQPELVPYLEDKYGVSASGGWWSE